MLKFYDQIVAKWLIKRLYFDMRLPITVFSKYVHTPKKILVELIDVISF